jgi:hypothetical protein
MNPETLWIIKVFFGGCAALSVLLGAILSFWDTVQNEKTDNTKVWFKRKWEAINKSRWLILPEKVTGWLLGLREIVSKFVVALLDRRWIKRFLTASVVIFYFTGLWLYWKLIIAISAFVIPLVLLGLIASYIPENLHRNLSIAFYIFMSVIGLLLWMLILLKLDIRYSAGIMLIISPFYWFIIAMPFISLMVLTSASVKFRYSLFFIGIATGFTLTFLALLLGNITDPSAYVPQTLQMLFSNVLFDGLTMVATFTILERALARDGIFRLPVAISLDILMLQC